MKEVVRRLPGSSKIILLGLSFRLSYRTYYCQEVVNGIFPGAERPLGFPTWGLSKGGLPSGPWLTMRPKDKERPLCLSWGAYELELGSALRDTDP